MVINARGQYVAAPSARFTIVVRTRKKRARVINQEKLARERNDDDTKGARIVVGIPPMMGIDHDAL
jgi:hypothetical protein